MALARKGKSRVRAYTDPKKALERFGEPHVQQQFRKTMHRWTKKTEPLVEAIRSAERLDESDFAIRINTKG